MNKHTKGPWTGGKECINDTKGRLLATVFFEALDGSDIITEEGYANSHLMAAAPEMLKALESQLMKCKGVQYQGGQCEISLVKKGCRKCGGVGVVVNSDPLPLIAIIKKAKGD